MRKKIESKSLLVAHIQETHERMYECSICNFRSKSISTLEKHTEDAHKTANKCRKCKKIFQNEDDLRKHLETHVQESKKEDFNCDTCDFQDKSRKALKTHLEKSPGHKPSQKSYECRNCNETFNSYYNLMTHRKVTHPTKKTCRYYNEGKCSFSADVCWYSHETHENKEENEHEERNETQDFQEKTKNLPPDMKVLINQLIKMSQGKK